MSVIQMFFAGGGSLQNLFAWGVNANGLLGLGDITNRSSPTQVGTLSTWQSASSYNHTLAIQKDGTLWAWGQGTQGQLGLGSYVSKSSPNQVGALTTWFIASAGANFSWAIKKDGTIWSWGQNSYGQLGQGAGAPDCNSPIQVGAQTYWTQVNAFASSVLIIGNSGRLYACGANYNGELGTSDLTNYDSPVQVGALTNWASLATGSNASHAVAIKTNGTLWAWGDNTDGALGTGNTTSQSSPVQVGALTTWSKVSRGYSFTAAVKTDGTLWTWGINNYGQLGDNTYPTSRSSPVQVGTATNWSNVFCLQNSLFALKTDGSIWASGQNSEGELGDGTITQKSALVQIGSLTNWGTLGGGQFSAMFITK